MVILKRAWISFRNIGNPCLVKRPLQQPLTRRGGGPSLPMLCIQMGKKWAFPHILAAHPSSQLFWLIKKMPSMSSLLIDYLFFFFFPSVCQIIVGNCHVAVICIRSYLDHVLEKSKKGISKLWIQPGDFRNDWRVFWFQSFSEGGSAKQRSMCETFSFYSWHPSFPRHMLNKLIINASESMGECLLACFSFTSLVGLCPYLLF